MGEIDDSSQQGEATYSIWTHKKFDIGYNGNQIVDVNLTSESKVKLTPDVEMTFSYEVSVSLVKIANGNGKRQRLDGSYTVR